MGLITVGQHVINLDAIAWVNLCFTWNEEIPVYIEDRNGFKKRADVKYQQRTGVFVKFTDGSSLTFPDSLPATLRLIDILNPITEEVDMPVYNHVENDILTGLPEDLRAAILKKE